MFMQLHSTEFSIEKMARVLEVCRSGYYAFLHRKKGVREKENSRLLKEIREAHEKSRGTYGSPRIHKQLQLQGHQCSRKRVAKIMQKEKIQAKTRRSWKKTTIASKSKREIDPNHLAQNFTVATPNKVWTSDITYIKTKEGWLYLAVVLDLFSRKIVGISMKKSLQTGLVIEALEQALYHREASKGLMHHSDRGCQYTSYEFKKLAKEKGIVLSMSAKGRCYDNAVTESFFHILKTEHVHRKNFRTTEEAKNSIFEYIEVFYNRQRIHSTLGYVSPERFEQSYKKIEAQNVKK